eukprot:gene2953-biopygen9097
MGSARKFLIHFSAGSDQGPGVQKEDSELRIALAAHGGSGTRIPPRGSFNRPCGSLTGPCVENVVKVVVVLLRGDRADLAPADIRREHQKVLRDEVRLIHPTVDVAAGDVIPDLHHGIELEDARVVEGGDVDTLRDEDVFHQLRDGLQRPLDPIKDLPVDAGAKLEGEGLPRADDTEVVFELCYHPLGPMMAEHSRTQKTAAFCVRDPAFCVQIPAFCVQLRSRSAAFCIQDSAFCVQILCSAFSCVLRSAAFRILRSAVFCVQLRSAFRILRPGCSARFRVRLSS